ncbi:hypothetical protein GOP47_0004445, partial [Adiantum capillus-veneris]
ERERERERDDERMSGNEPHLQALSARSRAASTNDSRFGYGGISEKISRLNDILRSLETRRSANTAENGYPMTWPPPLYNSARLLETKAALERSGHSLLNTRFRSGDGANEMPPSYIADGWDLQHRGSVLGTLRARHGQCGMVDTFMGHHQSASQSMPQCIGMHDMGRLASTSSMRKTLSRPRDSVLSTPGMDVCALPSYYRCSNDEYNMGHDYLCHPSENGYLYVPNDQPPLQKSTQSSCKPTDQRMTPFPVHPDARAHPSSVNVVDLAHTILARLEQLEMQQRAANRTPKLHHLSKKGSACKVGVDQKICRQRKGSFGEKGLLQLVRRRVKGDMPHAFGGQDSAKCKESITKHGDQETEKRFQRLENELELCWSAINQLCIDNEHFREEQRRWTQRTGTLQQLNENHLHVKPTYTSPKSKGRKLIASEAM